MARQPLPPGTHGVITVKQIGAKNFQARCYFRARNGETLRPAANGPSREAARNALRTKLTKLTTTATKGELTRNSLFGVAADLWLTSIAHQVEHGDMSPNTLRTYTTEVKRVKEYLELRLFELEDAVDVVDDMIKDIRVHHGYETAKKARTITSNICQFAIRRRAMSSNPARAVERLSRTAEEKRRAAEAVPHLTMAQIAVMRRGLEAFAELKVTETDRMGRRLGKRGAVWSDLPDMADACLATGQRLGEVLSLAGTDISEYDDDGNEWAYDHADASGEELRAGRHVAVRIDAHIVRYAGKGLRRVQGRKSGRPGITVGVPDWAAPMFLRRRIVAGDGPLFPAVGGGWLDQDNTNKRLREALDHAKLPWASARTWRKTVGTLLGHELSAEDVAEQLGNTRAVAEKHYIAPRRISGKGAAVLELIKPDQDETKTDTKSTLTPENSHHLEASHALLPGRTVGAAGLEPATARV